MSYVIKGYSKKVDNHAKEGNLFIQANFRKGMPVSSVYEEVKKV